MSDPFALTDADLRRLQEHTLVNRDRIFALIRRAFSGAADVIATELLQNSQRAGAGHVWIDFAYESTPTAQLPWFDAALDAPWNSAHYTSFTYRDDGVGLQNGPLSLFALLCLGESAYDEEVLGTQEPLGVGFYSLLANDQVGTVTLRSRRVEFTLDARRWWVETEYRSEWLTRLQAEDVPGFTVTVEASSDLLAQLHRTLCRTPGAGWRAFAAGPAAGFADLLEITVNDQSPALALPSDFSLAAASFTREYEGNTVAFNLQPAEVRGLLINWYGQLVHRHVGLPGAVSLIVRHGQPLTMLAPVRTGVVEDERLRSFKSWVVEQIWQHCTRAGHRPTGQELELLYFLDDARARRDVPYVAVRRVGGVPAEASSADELGDHAGDAAELEVLERAAAAEVPLVEDVVFLVRPPDAGVGTRWSDQTLLEDTSGRPRRDAEGYPLYGAPIQHALLPYDYGLASFVDVLGLTLYHPDVGCEATHALLWRPASAGDDLVTSALGHAALVRLAADGTVAVPPPTDLCWRPLPDSAEVFVFATPTIDFAEGEHRLLVGTANPPHGLTRFARLAHCHTEDDPDCCAWFAAVVDQVIRERYLAEPAIARATTLIGLLPQLMHVIPRLRRALGDAPMRAITMVEFLPTEDPDAPAGATAVQALRVHLDDGSVEFVRFYGVE